MLKIYTLPLFCPFLPFLFIAKVGLKETIPIRSNTRLIFFIGLVFRDYEINSFSSTLEIISMRGKKDNCGRQNVNFRNK